MKRIAAVILLIAAAVPARAQMIRGWGIEGGAVGAYELVTITPGAPSPVLPRVPQWGFSSGLFMEFLDIPHISILVETGYVQKGRSVSAEEIFASPSWPGALSSGPAGTLLRLDYVRLAILLKYRAGKVGFVPYLALGPQYDFLVGRKNASAALFSQIRKTDVGVSAAGGIEIVPGRSPVASLEARWSPVFTRVVTSPGITIRNQSVEFLLALWL